VNQAITVSCPAKVNLFLRVLAREADGYHGLETLFCRIGLADELTVERADDGIELEVSGADVGPVEQNLAWRAADAVLAAAGRRLGVRLQLIKRIPAGGGLGGGSSDAATALTTVNRLAGDAIPRGELLHLAARLGADVPFFASGASLALGWGHGQRLLTLPALPPRPAVLIFPGIAVATPAAYQWVDEVRGSSGPRGGLTLELATLGSWGDLARLGGNDFEAPVMGRHPPIKTAFEALAGTSPLLCRMSGSGSSLFAVYRTEQDRDHAAEQLGSRHGKVVSTTIGEGRDEKGER
jgi:4-diphosphocytidyl-2-C-methyl-D-erythritol kinase